MRNPTRNGGAAIRELLDARFTHADAWTKTVSGGIDWLKCHQTNATRVCVGVEIQVSARSDLLVMDIIHLRKALSDGVIDVRILAVPSDRMAAYLPSRAPFLSEAKKHVKAARSDDYPLMLLAFEHDGPGPLLPKRKKRSMDVELE